MAESLASAATFRKHLSALNAGLVILESGATAEDHARGGTAASFVQALKDAVRTLGAYEVLPRDHIYFHT